MATNSTNNNVTVKFLPTRSKGSTGMWLAISKPYSLTDAAKLAISTSFKYQIQRWGAEHVEEPSLKFAGTSLQKGATENLYYLGPQAIFGRPDVQAAIMGILSQEGALKVSAPQPAKAVPQSAGAVYQLLSAPQVAPQPVQPAQPVQPVAPQAQPAYQPQFLTFNLPQAPQVVPQPAAPQPQAEAPKKFIRIG